MKFCELVQAKNKVSTQTICGKYLLTLLTFKWVETNTVDPDQGCLIRSTLYAFTLVIYATAKNKQMLFSSEHLSSVLDEHFSRKLAEIDLSVFLINRYFPCFIRAF